MENRRPPRSNSSGRKPFADRSRGTSSYGGGGGASTGSGYKRRSPKVEGGSQDGQYRDSSASGQTGRTDARGNWNRKPGNRFNDRSGSGFNRQNTRKRTVRVEPEIRITSEDQITDGRLRGRKLFNSPSPHAAHTARKLREVAFKILSRRIKAARVLDLGAGCGTVGIEAISRGAMLATFVERSARMCTAVRRNLSALGIKNGHGEVIEMEILPFLVRSARRKRCWDIVYLNIPEGDPTTTVLDYLSRGLCIRTGGLLICEHRATAVYPDRLIQLRRWRTIDQGETILSIYERM